MPKLADLRAPLDIHQVRELLPQRYPFLMVDKVIEIVPSQHKDGATGRSVTIQKNVTVNEPHFNGHFPNFPLMPGVLQIEAMAQASAIASIDGIKEDEEMVIAGVNNARFRLPVVPGDILEVTSVVARYRPRFAVFKCVATVNGEIASEAELMASRAKVRS